MGSPCEEWNAIAGRLRDLPAEERVKHADFGTLYRLAMEHGPRDLRGMGIDPERAQDLVAELVIGKLDKLIAVREPFPFFRTAVKNAGRDWLRRKASKVLAEPQVERAPAAPPRAEERQLLDAVVARLSPLERRIFGLEAVGESRETIARLTLTNRANVDQIISRARKRLASEGLP